MRWRRPQRTGSFFGIAFGGVPLQGRLLEVAEGGRDIDVVEVGKAVRRQLDQHELKVCTVAVFVDVVVVVVAAVRNGSRVLLLCPDEVP